MKKHVFLIVVVVLAVFLTGCYQSETVTETETFTIISTSLDVLDVYTPNGSITINNGSGGTVEILAEKVVRASTREAAESGLEEIDISEGLASNGTYSISGDIPMNVDGEINITINNVPDGVDYLLDTVNGAIAVSDFAGDYFDIYTGNGNISIHVSEYNSLLKVGSVETAVGSLALNLNEDAVATAVLEGQSVTGTIYYNGPRISPYTFDGTGTGKITAKVSVGTLTMTTY